jgi:hypothetical protein
MKKAGAKRPKKKSSSRGKSRKPVDLVKVRENISNLVGAQAEEMAGALVDEGKKGQLAHTKFLFEMAGIYPKAAEAEPGPDDSDDLARVLLKELAFPQAGEEQAEAAELPEASVEADSVE